MDKATVTCNTAYSKEPGCHEEAEILINSSILENPVGCLPVGWGVYKAGKINKIACPHCLSRIRSASNGAG